MAKANRPFDTSKFITASQIGGIDAYVIDEGPARGVRALCVNTGAGLRYRVLVDRGLDIDQAAFNQHSLTFLSHQGVIPPSRSLDRGLDWLKGFPVGLLTSCGPWNIGAPCTDQGEDLGLHGPHSNTAASVESVVQPDPHAGRLDMSVVGLLRYGAFYGPCVELRRTIRSTLGENAIHITDEFYNAANTPVPHAWLLHINFGHPLLDAGAEFCYDAFKVEPVGDSPASAEYFKPGNNYKRIPNPLAQHSGPDSYVGYIYPRPARDGSATVAVVNRKLKLGVAVRYNTREFARCANWQHWGQREYVAALEPSTGTVEGRNKDRALRLLGSLRPGGRKTYAYSIAVVTAKDQMQSLLAMNKGAE